MHACVVGGSCGTRQLGTTYDGATSEASQVQAGNTILTTRFGVIESFAAARGYGYGAQAQRHLDAAQPYAGDLSSDTSLTGHEYAPGYLPDALLYATILGSTPTLTGELSAWLHGALISNQQAALQGSSTAVTPNSSGETITWISKALGGDTVAAWIHRTWPAWSTTTPDAGKLWNVWNRRSGGTFQGTFDFVTFPLDSYYSAGWYPRAVSLWVPCPPFHEIRPRVGQTDRSPPRSPPTWVPRDDLAALSTPPSRWPNAVVPLPVELKGRRRPLEYGSDLDTPLGATGEGSPLTARGIPGLASGKKKR